MINEQKLKELLEKLILFNSSRIGKELLNKKLEDVFGK